MKRTNILKLAICIAIVVLLSMISFVGIYVREQKNMVNIMPAYRLGMGLSEWLSITLKVNEGTKEMPVEHEHEEGEEHSEDEEEQTQTVLINDEEDKTELNYEISKSIIDKRLKGYGFSQYYIRQDKSNGDIVLEIENSERTLSVIQYMTYKGIFEIKDTATNEILMNNSDIKEAKALYSADPYGSGTVVYVNIVFNKKGKEKLLEISKTYTNESEQTISMYIEGEEIMSTGFEEERKDGKLQITMGQASTDSGTVQKYLVQASNIANLINNGNMQLQYEISNSLDIKSEIDLKFIAKIFGIITAIITIFIILKYKINGVFGSLAIAAFIAITLLAARYLNLILTVEGLFAILAGTILQILFVIIILKKYDAKEKSTFKDTVISFSKYMVPLIIIYGVFCFMSWLPVNSFGTIMLWQTVIMFLVNLTVLRELLNLNISGGKK